MVSLDDQHKRKRRRFFRHHCFRDLIECGPCSLLGKWFSPSLPFSPSFVSILFLLLFSSSICTSSFHNHFLLVRSSFVSSRLVISSLSLPSATTCLLVQLLSCLPLSKLYLYHSSSLSLTPFSYCPYLGYIYILLSFVGVESSKRKKKFFY